MPCAATDEASRTPAATGTAPHPPSRPRSVAAELVPLLLTLLARLLGSDPAPPCARLPGQGAAPVPPRPAAAAFVATVLRNAETLQLLLDSAAAHGLRVQRVDTGGGEPARADWGADPAVRFLGASPIADRGRVLVHRIERASDNVTQRASSPSRE